MISALALVSLVLCSQGKVAPAGALKTARANHSASLLHDGRILVVGGRGLDALSTLTQVELFTPKTKKWSLAASLGQGRSHHTATVLADGRVLVTGGTTHDSSSDGAARFIAVASAELYDPAQNSWATVEPMHEARNGHTATLLSDGRVMIAGGAKEQRSHLASVELFDPASGHWSFGPSLLLARWQHEAVRLSDGSVVVVAGRSNQGQTPAGSGLAIAEAERFVDGHWQVLGPLREPRQRAATVARGTSVTVIGGISTTTATNYVETWAVGASGWALGDANLTMALSAHTASVVSGVDVVVIGGEPPAAVDTRRIQKWNNALSKWCDAGKLSVSRKQHTATVLPDGSIVVIGGLSAGVPEASVEWWQPLKGTCTEPGGVAAE